MASQQQKIKTLYLMQILLERTDENHMLNASELCEILLNEYDISVDRRTIYSEIEMLKNFGLDIFQKKGTHPGYCVTSRKFELPELKLLVDSVQASKCLTEKKSRELIKKIESLCSRAEAKQLSQQVVILNRPKTINETIYYNVDQLHTAIYHNRQIIFQYAEWTTRKELRLKHDGDYYRASPLGLLWDDENYYLVAYDEKGDRIKHYRVDKMQHIELLEDERSGKERIQKFNLASYSKKTFGMYRGEDVEVSLLCERRLAGVILDRFGQDIWMIPVDEEHFRAKILVSVNQQFFGWVTGIGKAMEIEGPVEVRDMYKEYLRNIIDRY